MQSWKLIFAIWSRTFNCLMCCAEHRHWLSQDKEVISYFCYNHETLLLFADCHRCPYLSSSYKYFANGWVSDKEGSCLGNYKCNIWRLCWTDQVWNSLNLSMQLTELVFVQEIKLINQKLKKNPIMYAFSVVSSEPGLCIELWMRHSFL